MSCSRRGACRGCRFPREAVCIHGSGRSLLEVSASASVGGAFLRVVVILKERTNSPAYASLPGFVSGSLGANVHPHRGFFLLQELRPPSSEAYVYTALAVPKTELSTTEWASRRLRCWGPVMAPPLVAMPPIIMVPIFSSRCDPGMPARRGRSGSALGAPVTGSRSQHDRCDGYKTHFHDPYHALLVTTHDG